MQSGHQMKPNKADMQLCVSIIGMYKSGIMSPRIHVLVVLQESIEGWEGDGSIQSVDEHPAIGRRLDGEGVHLPPTGHHKLVCRERPGIIRVDPASA